jgi:hypothetical protein
LITPSTHGLHHAINEEYLDKNFGGIFSVWDQLFGTFVRERPDVEPRYGIVRQLGSWNPIAAVLTPWAELVALSLQSRSLPDLARVWFGRPAYLYGRLANATPPQRRPASGPGRLWVYLLAQVLLPGALLLALMARGESMAPATRLLIPGFALASMYCAGALQDRARFAVAAERARLVAVIALGWLGLLGFEQLPGLSSILELPGDAAAAAWGIALGCSGFAFASLLWLQRGYQRRNWAERAFTAK